MSAVAQFFFVLCGSFVINYGFDPAKFDYCKINCDTEKHQGCGCKNTPPEDTTEVVTNHAEFRRQMIDYLNKKRNSIAASEGGTNKLPEAADMMLMNYDLELEHLARCVERTEWVFKKECMITSENRRYYTYGYSVYPAPTEEPKTLDNEFNYGFEQLLQQNGTVRVDFYSWKMAPIIWSSLNHVGCARFITDTYHIRCCFSGNNNTKILKGEPIYKIGKACSACPDNTKCDQNKWKSLCGKKEPVPTTPLSDLQLYPTTTDNPEPEEHYEIENEYCKLKSDNKRHPACGCEETKNSKREILGGIINFRKIVLDFHNRFRDKVASGKQEIEVDEEEKTVKKYLPTAGNMLVMNYDLEMELLARCRCRRYDDTEKKCWTALDGRKVAQISSERYSLVYSSSFYVGIDYLTNEVIKSLKIDLTTDKYPYRNELLPYGYKRLRYTVRMILSSVNQVGCARCSNRFTCFYNSDDDLGQAFGKPIYTIGKPCSSCPGDTSCSQNEYEALCGKIEAVPQTVADLPQEQLWNDGTDKFEDSRTEENWEVPEEIVTRFDPEDDTTEREGDFYLSAAKKKNNCNNVAILTIIVLHLLHRL